MDSRYKTLIRYWGGKSNALNVFNRKIIVEGDVVLSPFFGGGSYELNLNRYSSKKIIANDLYDKLYNFWNGVKENQVEVYELCKTYKDLTKEQFDTIKDKFFNDYENLTDVEKSAYFWVLNKTSYNGSMTGYSKSSVKNINDNSLKQIKKIDMENITIENKDFEDFLNQYDKDIFVYADPPYRLGEGQNAKNNLYGDNGNLHKQFNHERFYNVMKERNNWVISYNDSEYIRNLYKDYKIVKVDWVYAGTNNKKPSSEILIYSK